MPCVLYINLRQSENEREFENDQRTIRRVKEKMSKHQKKLPFVFAFAQCERTLGHEIFAK